MKLYFMPGACSMAAHIVVEEAHALDEITPTLVRRGENRAAAYLAVNPRGFVPTLELADGILTEAVAVLLYLARRYPKASLLPEAGTVSEARVLEWLAWLSSTVHVAYACLWRPERFTPDDAAGQALVGYARDRIAACNDEIELRMADGRRFAVGTGYTLADPYLLVFFRWANRIGLDAPTAYPAWTAWAKIVGERPAVARVLQREGVSLWE